MRISIVLLLYLIINGVFAQNNLPEISNLIVEFDNTNQTLNVTYDLFDAEGESIDIHFLVSDDNGISYLINTENATGDIGTGIPSGLDKNIIWEAGGNLTGSEMYQVKLVANDLFEIDIQEIVNQVDSNRLRRNLEFIEGTRHRITNADHLEAIKDSIENRFIAADLITSRLDFPFNSYTGQNIFGRLEGSTQADSVYIIDAHFDSVDDTPGADDNGSSVAGLLEALRVLTPYSFNKTLHFIGFDLEESGLLGSRDYATNSIPEQVTVHGVFNMEMIGYYSEEVNSQTFPAGFNFLYPDVQAQLVADSFRGNFITNIGDVNSGSLMNSYISAANEYVPELKVISLQAPVNWITLTPDLGRSDHAAFWFQGIHALMLTDGSEFRNPNYHTENDTLGSLDFTFMSHVVKAVVAAVAEEAEVEHSSFATAEFTTASSVKSELDCTFQVSAIPVDEELSLSFERCPHDFLSIEVYDITGKIVLEQDVQPAHVNHVKLNLSSIASGMYIMRLTNGSQELSREILVN